MKAEAIAWLATSLGSPVVLVTLCWILAIFSSHRHSWQSTDLLIANILLQGVVKQIGTFVYAIITLLHTSDSNEAWCSAIVWLLTSIHVLQAGTLATLIFSRLLAVRSPVKYRQAVKRIHIIYHLVSLSILSCCIGVAAVLAERKDDRGLEEATNITSTNYDTEIQHCTFVPHEMDRRYAVLSVTLHSFLDVSSLVALIVTIFSWFCLYRRQKSNVSLSQPSTIVPSHGNQNRNLLTSSSNLSAMSDISLISRARHGSSKTQNGGNSSSSDRIAKTDILSGKCATNESHFMNGLLASNLRYMDSADGNLQPKITLLPSPPKTTILDALPTLSRNSGLSSVVKSSSDANCFLPNANSALPTAFPNSSGPVIGSSTNKSTGTLKSCVATSSYNHTAHKSLTTSGSSYETYDRNYAATGIGNTEDGCRWTSEPSCISTSTTSTNSRVPCLQRQTSREEEVMMGHEDLRLPSVICVAVVCYGLNHLPVLGLTVVGMFAPWLLPRVWPLTALVLWAGIAEDCLLPFLLPLCDRNFTAWVSSFYNSRHRRTDDLARQHQGLDGKFRAFGTQTQHQPDVQSSIQLQSHQNLQHVQQEPVKFPITNGSLFTSVDGRLPIIHNYRRGMRTSGAVPPHCTTTELLATQMGRNELLQTLINLKTAAIENQHSELYKQRKSTIDGTIKLSQNFTDKTCDIRGYLPTEMDTVQKNVANQVTQNSRQQKEKGNLLTGFRIGNLKPEQPSSDCEDYLNSDDLNEYNVDDDDDDYAKSIYETLSSHSCCSATTAANDDFEFFQHEEQMSETVDVTEKSTVLRNNEKLCIHGPQSEERNCDQSLLYKYHREILGHADYVPQACQCADGTVDENNKVLKLVQSLRQSYQNQNNNTEFSYQSNKQCNGKNLSHCQTITRNESEVMKTVTQNDFKNYKCNALMKGTSGRSSTITDPEFKRKDSNCNFQQIQSKANRKNRHLSRNTNSLKLSHVTSVTRKKRDQKQSSLGSSVSLTNLDGLLSEEEENDVVVQRRSRRKHHNEIRNGPKNDSSSSDEIEVVFELPVKSESVLSLYQFDLDGENSSGRHKIIDTICKEANTKRFHKQVPGNCHILGQPLTRHSSQQTPPRRRPHRQKQHSVPVLLNHP